MDLLKTKGPQNGHCNSKQKEYSPERACLHANRKNNAFQQIPDEVGGLSQREGARHRTDRPDRMERELSWEWRAHAAQVGPSLAAQGRLLWIPLLTPHNVNLKNKIATYFTSKMGFFGNSRELQFGTSNLQQATGTSGKTKGREAFIWFQEETGEDVLNRSLLENKSWRLWQFPIGCKWWLVRPCWGREGASFFFLKAGDEVPM